ncbi:uncharacterized protein LOC127845015 isoform X1 [Dreissena polymorpha]|uniref:uncharacterized protein LOC127845015 isoform X1 n=1 Tax=Dreissena polymorpha TaxID=45954 RepID=UPI002263DAD3|nr:uncharacterized protein LOC127845015 isoform X1 [Dreissena polymorpha]
MATIPLSCDVCIKTFSGHVPAQQHFASAEHRRKLENQSRSNHSGHYCSVCKIRCDTADVLNNHLISPRHNAMVEKQRGMDCSSRSNSTHSKDRSTNNEYDFDGKRGFCHVCKLELTSPSHASSHLNGKNHQKKALQWAVRNNKPASTTNTNSERCNVFRRLDYQDKTFVRESTENTGQQVSGAEAYSRDLPLGSVSDLFRDVCNAGFTGPETQDAHMIGEKHRNDNGRFEAEKSGAVQPLGCNACNINYFSGPESADDHFKSQAHAKNTKNNNIKNRSPTSDSRTSSFKNVNIDRAETFVKQEMQAFKPLVRNDNTDDNTLSTVSDLNIKPFESDRHGNRGLNFERQESRETDEGKIKEDMQSTTTDNLSHLSLSSFESDASSGRSSRVTAPFRVVVNPVDSYTTGIGRGRGVLDILEQRQTLSLGGMFLKTEREDTALKQGMKTEVSARNVSSFNDTVKLSAVEPVYRPLNARDNLVPSGINGLSNSNRPMFENASCSQANIYSQHRIVSSPSDSDGNLSSECNIFDAGMQVHPRGSYLSYLSQEPTSAAEQTPVADYNFDTLTGTGRCFLCRVDFTSEQHMQQHVSGKNHLKAQQHKQTRRPVSTVSVADLQPSKRVFVCDACSVTISGYDNYQQHLQGAKHMKNTTTSAFDAIDKTIWHTCSVCFTQCNTSEHLLIHMKAKHAIEEIDVPVKVFYCDICKVPCSGEDNYRQHLEGAKHRKAAGISSELPIIESTDRTAWCVCPTCGVKTNTFKHLEIHMRSKHAQDAVHPAKGNPFDKTSWHKCTVCGSKAITVEQLQTHMIQTHQTWAENSKNASHDRDHIGDRSNAGYKSPLDEFLQEELFPAEYLPTELKDCQSHYTKSRIEPEVTTTRVALLHKYAQVLEQDSGSPTDNCTNSNVKRGMPSDLAYATRNKNVGKQESNFKAATGVYHPSKRTEASTCTNPYAATHNYYCHTCKAPMNTQDSYEAHMKGKRHLSKVCTEPAPVREHLPALDFASNHVPYTVSKPRNYQLELYRKAMANDVLVFLPTGTGKTLVSVMTISAMLEKFPTRNVLFLVDKVLLVLQQSKYIQREIGERSFYRFNDETEDCTELVERRLRIAALCMGQQSTGGVPLWKHDVIVVTAAFCQNLLDKGIVRWEDFSLVVFDEAHHCDKDHPFNQLLTNYQRKENTIKPKVLALTASPAGKKNVQESFGMLVKLVENLGKARMSIVEEPKCKATLESYQSNANMETRTPMDGEEDSDQDSQFGFQKSFSKELNIYIMYCVLRLAEVSDIRIYVAIDKKLKPGTAEAVIRMLADDFVSKELDNIQNSLNDIKPSSNIEEVQFSMLRSHTQGVCMARSSLLDGGVYCALRDLDELGKANFNFAKSIGLPTETLVELQMCDRDLFFIESPPVNMPNMPLDNHVKHLIDILTGIERDDSFSGGNTISLVLVQQRGTAFHLTDLLKRSERMQRAGLLTTTMVGHGSTGSSAGGMSVKQQKSVLEEIKQNKYQVVVATSVAEEGVDWPECDRVISMYPPKTVTALVQMRGRARKKDSKFIVLCTSSAEEGKLTDIMEREKYMIEATARLVQLQKNEECNIVVPLPASTSRIVTRLSPASTYRNLMTIPTRTDSVQFMQSCWPISSGISEISQRRVVEFVEEIRSSRTSRQNKSTRRTTSVQTTFMKDRSYQDNTGTNQRATISHPTGSKSQGKIRKTVIQTTLEDRSYKENTGINQRATISPSTLMTKKRLRLKKRQRSHTPQLISWPSDESDDEQHRKRARLESPGLWRTSPVPQAAYLTDHRSRDCSQSVRKRTTGKSAGRRSFLSQFVADPRSRDGSDQTRKRKKDESPISRPLCPVKSLPPPPCCTHRYSDSDEAVECQRFFFHETHNATLVLNQTRIERCDEHTESNGTFTSIYAEDYSWESEKNKSKRSRKRNQNRRRRKRGSLARLHILLQKNRVDLTKRLASPTLTSVSDRTPSLRSNTIENILTDDIETSFKSRYNFGTTSTRFKKSRKRNPEYPKAAYGSSLVRQSALLCNDSDGALSRSQRYVEMTSKDKGLMKITFTNKRN